MVLLIKKMTPPIIRSDGKYFKKTEPTELRNVINLGLPVKIVYSNPQSKKIIERSSAVLFEKFSIKIIKKLMEKIKNIEGIINCEFFTNSKLLIKKRNIPIKKINVLKKSLNFCELPNKI